MFLLLIQETIVLVNHSLHRIYTITFDIVHMNKILDNIHLEFRQIDHVENIIIKIYHIKVESKAAKI